MDIEYHLFNLERLEIILVRVRVRVRVRARARVVML